MPEVEARGATERAKERVANWRHEDKAESVLEAPGIVELAARRLALCRAQDNIDCTKKCPLYKYRQAGMSCRMSTQVEWERRHRVLKGRGND